MSKLFQYVVSKDILRAVFASLDNRGPSWFECQMHMQGVKEQKRQRVLRVRVEMQQLDIEARHKAAQQRMRDNATQTV